MLMFKVERRTKQKKGALGSGIRRYMYTITLAVTDPDNVLFTQARVKGGGICGSRPSRVFFFCCLTPCS